MGVDPAWLDRTRLANQQKHGLAGLGASPAQIVSTYRAQAQGSQAEPSQLVSGLITATKVVAGVGLAAVVLSFFWPSKE